MLDTEFRNAVLKEIVRIMNIESSPESRATRPSMGPSLEVVNIIYQGTPSGSPARRLLVDWCIAFGHQSQYTMLHEKEFLLGLAVSLSDKVEKGLPSSEFRGVSLRDDRYVI